MRKAPMTITAYPVVRRDDVRRSVVRRDDVRRSDVRRPGPSRPAGTPVRYVRPAVAMSTAQHRPKSVSVLVTAALAGAAALITLWLGSVAQSGGVTGATPEVVPDRLAVVQVEAGESLQQVAARVAPEAPTGPMVDRIRELNKLGDAGPVQGQTLIAPVG